MTAWTAPRRDLDAAITNARLALETAENRAKAIHALGEATRIAAAQQAQERAVIRRARDLRRHSPDPFEVALALATLRTPTDPEAAHHRATLASALRSTHA